MASNCGQCPNTTVNTTATCRRNNTKLTNSAPCSFAVQSEACGDTAGDVSMAVNVIWRDINALHLPTETAEIDSTEREVAQC